MKILLTIIMAFGLFTMYAQKTAPMQVEVSTYDKEPLAGEQIVFFGQTSKTEILGVTGPDGKCSVNLPEGETYDIKVRSVGDELDYSSISIPTLEENEEFTEATLTVMIEEPTSFTLNNVHFSTGSADLKSSSSKELNELANYLNLKKSVKVEIGGHTDNVGADDSNQKLSQKRAEAVKEFLIKKGVSENRLKSKGYGETKPVASNDSDKGKAMNRRTEVVFL
jgi:OOP family OmpA-OmpF porin